MDLAVHPEAVLDVRDMSVWIKAPVGEVNPVRGVSLSVARGECLSVIGESGSGKSTLVWALMTMGRSPHGGRVEGEVRIEDRNILALEGSDLERLRGHVGLIMQQPMSALDPIARIERQFAETLAQHSGLTGEAARTRMRELLSSAEFPDPDRILRSYPHELSGGQCQRVLFALALANDCALLLADEPTSSLDVTVQAEILALLHERRLERNMTVVFVTHDLDVAASVSERTAVMYGGRIVEIGPSDIVTQRPAMPYTSDLLNALPDPAQPGRKLVPISGIPPSRPEKVKGCPYQTRCTLAEARCREELPELRAVAEGQMAACHRPLTYAAATASAY